MSLNYSVSYLHVLDLDQESHEEDLNVILLKEFNSKQGQLKFMNFIIVIFIIIIIISFIFEEQVGLKVEVNSVTEVIIDFNYY